MRRVKTVYEIPDMVLKAWQENWNSETGFNMCCGNSRYNVPASNKYDMWVWVRSNANHPRLRGRVELLKTKNS